MQATVSVGTNFPVSLAFQYHQSQRVISFSFPKVDPTFTIIGITVLVNFIPISMKTLFAFYLRFIRCKARGIVPGSHRLNARGLVMFITSKFT